MMGLPMAEHARWFQTELALGMAHLLALNLQDRPAADMVETMIRVWCQALWPARLWEERRDKPRIKTAFQRLALSCERWPVPGQFLQAVPPIDAPLALAHEIDFDAAERRLAELFQVMRDRGAPIDDGGLERLQQRLGVKGGDQ